MPHTKNFEKIIADYIGPVVRDMHLIDINLYIKYIDEKRYACLSEIIETSTELYFYPYAISFANKGNYWLDEDKYPVIALDMKFFTSSIQVSFCLVMALNFFSINLKELNITEKSKKKDLLRCLILAFHEACLPSLAKNLNSIH